MVERFEVLIVDTQSAKELPYSLNGIQFGTVGRKIVQVKALRASGKAMIAGIVHDQDRPTAAIPMSYQVLQECGEGFCVKWRGAHGDEFSRTNLHGAE